MLISKNIKFIKGSGTHKYTAILPDGRRVHFGHVDYQHYKDSVPVAQGGGVWKHLNHLDPKRRKNYRTRHAGMVCKNGVQCISIKYSPAWFSYYFLW
jgi:hypothetical protein